MWLEGCKLDKSQTWNLGYCLLAFMLLLLLWLQSVWQNASQLAT